jgi:hypothetical protein
VFGAEAVLVFAFAVFAGLRMPSRAIHSNSIRTISQGTTTANGEGSSRKRKRDDGGPTGVWTVPIISCHLLSAPSISTNEKCSHKRKQKNDIPGPIQKVAQRVPPRRPAPTLFTLPPEIREKLWKEAISSDTSLVWLGRKRLDLDKKSVYAVDVSISNKGRLIRCKRGVVSQALEG